SIENQLAAELKALLKGVSLGSAFDIQPSHDILMSLEIYIPRVLRTKYAAWKSESIDGFFVSAATRHKLAGIEMYGTCILISDQAVTPFLIRILMDMSLSSIIDCIVCVGEPGGGAIGISGPLCNSRQARELLESLPSRIRKIDWKYTASLRESGLS